MAGSVYKWLFIPLLALLLISARPVPPHPFHVSVVEIEHNTPDKSLEISCKIFTDDFEKVLAETYKTKVDLINSPNKAAMDSLIKEKIIGEPHSVYPICDGDIDNLKGVVSIKDLYVSPDSTLFKELMLPALFVPENNSPYQVLEKFKESRLHSCFIVDEYGSVLGLITLNDILEAIVGDMPQPDVPDYEIREREDGTFVVDGQIPFYDFLSRFEKAEWMNEGEHDFDTLAGFILHQLERIPKQGDRLAWKGFKIEVIDMDGHRIDKVLVTLSEELKEDMEE